MFESKKCLVSFLLLCFSSIIISNVIRKPFDQFGLEINVKHNVLNGQPLLDVVRDNKVIQMISLGIDFGPTLSIVNEIDGFRLLGNTNSVKLKILQANVDFILFHVTSVLPKNTTQADCFNLDLNNTNWYGGPQQKFQYWPIQKLTLKNYSYVSKELDNTGIAERYWLNSNGVFLFVDDETPLFIDQNSQRPGYLCFVAQKSLPYDQYTNNFNFAYNIGISLNARTAHLNAIKYFLKKPTNIPDTRMIRHPIWSTWAKYKTEINETVVLKFADEILNYKFNNSQYEIDDDWEVCYGALTFNQNKFPNIKNLTNTLKQKGFRVTLWVHPFINKNCEPWYSEAKAKGFLVKDHHNNTDTKWWNSLANQSSYVDFSKTAAAKWFSGRLQKLLNVSGIDSYKFDAGESSWTPPDPVLQGPTDLHPSIITKDYIRTVSKFGPMVEVRSGQRTQDLPIFLRMIDKDSNWDWNNGLPTLVTTLLQLNMVGYSFVLPDMIGGNGYEGAPSKEMFIRWLAANVFMPSLQFSYVPWDYDNETITISTKFTKLHDQFSNEIINRFRLAVITGEPVNPPLWWVDPTDKIAQAVNDQFLLGDNIIAAPIIKLGERSRSIYLPSGNWEDGNNGTLYQGPIVINNYPAPLDIIPYFVRVF